MRRLRQVATLAHEKELTFLAAAIAYYAFVSLLPALLLALVLASSFGGPRLGELVVAGAGEFLTPAGQNLILDAVRGATGRTGATIVGVLGLLWGTLKVFRGFDTAIARLYGAPPSGLVPRLRDAAIVVAIIGIGIGTMIGVGTHLALSTSLLGRLLALGFLLIGLGLVFLPLYVVFPEDVSLVEALPGTIVASLGWVTLQGLFQLYAEFAGRFELYGVIGGVLLLVTWFYLASILLLVGAAVNVVFADRMNRQGQGPGA